MATETDTSPAGWSTETLKQLFSTMHNDLKDMVSGLFNERERLNEGRIEAVIAAQKAYSAAVEAHFAAMDKAAVILAENVNRVPTLLDREIARVVVLANEKFNGVQRQFAERDVRTEANQKSAETAVNAALSAQKEAVAQQNAAYAASSAKSEAATTKQMDSIVALLGSQSRALEDKINDINRRLDRDQGQKAGASLTVSTVIVIIGVMIALLGVGVNFIHGQIAH